MPAKPTQSRHRTAKTTPSRATGPGPVTKSRPGAREAGTQSGSALVWVFGYGSLMWNPGFPFRARESALVHGWHRAFCVYSHVWRGTPERPGLVLGLDRGGSCRGIAFAVDRGNEADVLAYLDARERVTNVYMRKAITVELASGRTIGAWSYVADRAHSQYAGKLALEHAATLIAHGVGQGGPNPEYLENTVRHLDQLGISEGPLHALRDRVRRLAP